MMKRVVDDVRYWSWSFSRLFIAVTIALSLLLWVFPLLVNAQDIPGPLPEECGGVNPGGPDPSCCAFGYVYFNGMPIADASVRVENAQGYLDILTGTGSASAYPYYGADLTPLQVSAGDVITITATYGGYSQYVVHQVASGAQQVDVVLEYAAVNYKTYTARDWEKVLLTGRTTVTVSEFQFDDVPAGDIVILATVDAQISGTGSRNGILNLEAEGVVVDTQATDCLEEYHTNMTLHGSLRNFAGGTLHVKVVAIGEDSDTALRFGSSSGSDSRFARKVTVYAGLPANTTYEARDPSTVILQGQTTMSVGEFEFTGVPAGDVMVFATVNGQKHGDGVSDHATLYLESPLGSVIDQAGAHTFDNSHTFILLHGIVRNFDGGTLSVNIRAVGEETDTSLRFGSNDGDEPYTSRHVTVMATGQSRSLYEYRDSSTKYVQGQVDVVLSEGVFPDVPAGDVNVVVSLDGLRESDSNHGRVDLFVNGVQLDYVATHALGAEGHTYLYLHGALPNFSGGVVTATVVASGEDSDTNLRFAAVGGDQERFARHITVLADAPNQEEDIHTLILVNYQQVKALFGTASANMLLSKLNSLAAHDTVKGKVLSVENNAAVVAAYAARSTEYDDKDKANALAEAIRQVVLSQRSLYPDLEYVVIVGDDRVIPFYRIADGTRTADPWTLTDDFYTARQPVYCPHCAKVWLYVPDLAGGRLVEAPEHIIGQIDTYLNGYSANLDGAAVTGYDFLKDGAQAQCQALQSDTITADCSLIGETWDDADFRDLIVNNSRQAMSFNGHARYSGFFAPDNVLISAADFANTSADFARVIVYSVGCHAGQNVPAVLDLPEAFASMGANYVANTGYGWGYYTTVGLSEQLMLNFTEHLVQGSSSVVGKALVMAKRRYYLDRGKDFDAYDEKISTESTLYGLPMYIYNTPTATSRNRNAEADARVYASALQILEDGLSKKSVSYQFPAIIAQSTGEGDYYAFGDQLHASSNDPVQPKYVAEITDTSPQTQVHGLVFTGGLYTDTLAFDPIIERAITESVQTPEPLFSKPGWYPQFPYRLNILEDSATLVTVLGQYHAQQQAERIYDHLSFDIYYHTPSEDWEAPGVSQMRSAFDSDTISVSVIADDVSGIQAVVVAYTQGTGQWYSLALEEDATGWRGNFPGTLTTQFMLQVVDGVGNVSVFTNQGQYYQPGDSFGMPTLYLPLIMR